jgi:hypothetical protein
MRKQERRIVNRLRKRWGKKNGVVPHVYENLGTLSDTDKRNRPRARHNSAAIQPDSEKKTPASPARRHLAGASFPPGGVAGLRDAGLSDRN